MMRVLIFSLLLVFSAGTYAESSELIIRNFTPIDVSNVYDAANSIGIEGLPDLVEKEEKIEKCVAEYIATQSKSYAKIVQNNLYDLIHNFNKITSKVYGKKPPADTIPHNEKIEALAKVQCEVYYTTGVLK